MIDETPFYLAFTEGWGDEDIIKCIPLAESSQSRRLVLCRVTPAVFVEGRYLDEHEDRYFDRIFLFDRFSEERWLPVIGRTNVGILVGQQDLEGLDPASLQMIDWATVFPTMQEAEQARQALRG